MVMSTRRPVILVFIGLIAGLLAGPLTAAAQELALNGAGTRKAFFIDLYTCSLWVAAPTRSEDELLNRDTPARVKILVHGNPPGAAPPEDWAALLKSELSGKYYKLTKRTYRDLEEGDEIIVQYPDGEGTSVSVNGEHILTDPGRALMVAILEQWIGPEPVSDELKVALLDPQD